MDLVTSATMGCSNILASLAQAHAHGQLHMLLAPHHVQAATVGQQRRVAVMHLSASNDACARAPLSVHVHACMRVSVSMSVCESANASVWLSVCAHGCACVRVCVRAAVAWACSQADLRAFS